MAIFAREACLFSEIDDNIDSITSDELGVDSVLERANDMKQMYENITENIEKAQEKQQELSENSTLDYLRHFGF